MEIKFPSNKIVKIKKIKCPTCNKKSIEMYAPFCSKKCANLDLSKWLTNGHYTEINKD